MHIIPLAIAFVKRSKPGRSFSLNGGEEYTIETDDFKGADKIFQKLGFRKLREVHKHRDIYTYKEPRGDLAWVCPGLVPG